MRIAAVLAACSMIWVSCTSSYRASPDLVAQLPARVDYNLHIKPLLSDRCYSCHGPDDNARQADLRLHTEEGALNTRLNSGGRAIVRGSLRRSKVMRRIFSRDPEFMMPPLESNLHLSAYEKALIARWIDQGAEWSPHWAFVAPTSPELPMVQDVAWPRDSLDHFVLARLEREGLAPSPEADRERLLRRVTFDLTGLPPTIAAIDAYMADTSEGAYERVVDGLLASERYGERMATEWMDVARYADSHGYHADGIRTMWPWRDWVIRAFNRNMPYDDFATWQLAGDLLPNATREQKLATGFNRNHPMTAEGGVIDEEYRIEYVADRTQTTAHAFMGLTMECARCHAHKFDPVSQREYYQLSAFFNNVNELGMTGDDGNAGPLMMMPSAEEEAALEEAREQVATIETLMPSRRAKVLETASYRDTVPPPGSLAHGLVAHYPLDEIADGTTSNLFGQDGSVRGELELTDGPRDKAVHFDNDYDNIRLEKEGLFERTDPFTISLWINRDQEGDYTKLLGNAFHKNTYWRGWELYLDSLSHLSVRLIHAKPHNYLHVRTNRTIGVGTWTHVTLTYDGSSRADGVRLYIDGAEPPVTVEHDNLYKSIHPVDHHYKPTQLAVLVARSYRAFGGKDGIYRGSMDDLRLYERALVPAEVARLAGSDLPATDNAMVETYLHHIDAEYRQLLADIQAARALEHERAEPIMEVMVMEEMDTKRNTFVLRRGLYDQRTESVAPGVPAVLGEFSDAFAPNRLGLPGNHSSSLTTSPQGA